MAKHSPNDDRGIVKNPNNAAFEAARINRLIQLSKSKKSK